MAIRTSYETVAPAMPIKNVLVATLARRTARAYLLGHITDTGPRLLKVVFLLYRRRLGVKGGFNKALDVVVSNLEYNKFPAFCATLFGLYTSLEYVYYRIAQGLLGILLNPSKRADHDRSLTLRLCRIAAGLTASSLSFRLLNAPTASDRRTSDKSRKAQVDPNGAPVEQSASTTFSTNLIPAGRTLDFTLLISVRAIEALIGEGWRRYRQPKASQTLRASFEAVVSRLADPAVFVTSAGIVMWTWFYTPERLPPAYQRWISQAAAVDQRLIQALRNCRSGDFVYGQETGQAPLLQGMCKEYGWPMVWGDPAKTIPVPCEMVHMGVGNSCHVHGISRFMRAFQFAFAMYLPIQLAVKMRTPSVMTFMVSITEAARSAAFLGSFIGLFYYCVCLSRTVLGPRLFSRKTISEQDWDGGLCVGAGCAACGLSVFLEKPQRRPELAFFVAPKAAAVFLPRKYDRKYLWREQVAFAMSAATLLAMIEENPKSARGLVAYVLNKVLA